ncbi:hypothetical protein [Nocardia abscessus]|uniref:hypothetical protein n=1 Tax=Nocardia abscessus TaxID=120957 RepID=UPI001E43A495|nr:hypothetical protein [Nocardia abscessus]
MYIDVDGPLNPYAAKRERRPAGYETFRKLTDSRCSRYPGEPARRVKLRVWLNPEHGRQLLRLAELYELTWATSWSEEANTWIAPKVGLPELPVVAWPTMYDAGPEQTFWKTRHLVSHAAGRPFAWIDDEISERDRDFVGYYHDGQALLHHVDPRVGLCGRDFDILESWARMIAAAQAT